MTVQRFLCDVTRPCNEAVCMRNLCAAHCAGSLHICVSVLIVVLSFYKKLAWNSFVRDVIYQTNITSMSKSGSSFITLSYSAFLRTGNFSKCSVSCFSIYGIVLLIFNLLSSFLTFKRDTPFCYVKYQYN